MTVISVIVGSTRDGRFSEKPAKWILDHLKKRDGVDARLLDLRDFPMPFFDQPVTPATPGRPPYKNEVVQRWTAAIAQSDGFVFVTPEYNYGPSAVLKNAIARTVRARSLTQETTQMRNPEFTEKVVLKAPQEIVEAMKAASRRRLMSKSEYVRQSILAQLERDGYCPIRPAA